jgi:large subunit ribosomal protein L21
LVVFDLTPFDELYRFLFLILTQEGEQAMYAVIRSGGKQQRVVPGDNLRVEKIPGAVGETVTFDEVLLTGDSDSVTVGTPTVANASVSAVITRQAKSKKITVFKYKRRKGYRRKRGHRQPFTEVRVQSIYA